jgi:hypothetical protein
MYIIFFYNKLCACLIHLYNIYLAWKKLKNEAKTKIRPQAHVQNLYI